jgi:hypothetical protein
LEPALFQVEALAFPIPEGRLNPLAFAAPLNCAGLKFVPPPFGGTAPSPRLGVGRLIQAPIPGAIRSRRPVGDHVHGTEEVVLVQINAVQKAALAPLQLQGSQALPVPVSRVKGDLALQADLPRPAVTLTDPLEGHAAELTVRIQMHPPRRGWEVGPEPLAQTDLAHAVAGSQVEHVPGEREDPFPMGYAEGQDAPAVFQVRAVHHEIHLPLRPDGQQVMGEHPITVGGRHAFVLEEPPPALDQVFALLGFREREPQHNQALHQPLMEL